MEPLLASTFTKDHWLVTIRSAIADAFDERVVRGPIDVSFIFNVAILLDIALVLVANNTFFVVRVITFFFI